MASVPEAGRDGGDLAEELRHESRVGPADDGVGASPTLGLDQPKLKRRFSPPRGMDRGPASRTRST